MIRLHFPNIKKSETEVIETLPINATEPVEGFLDDISSDSGVQLLVDQLISQNRSKLDIVSECMNSYGSYFYRMRFIDRARVIDRYINYLAKK